MNTTDLTRAVFNRLRKYKFIILAAGVVFAVTLFLYARSKNIIYTSKATVFPLTTNSDNALSGSALSGILGLSDIPKSFSSEATINIIELTSSRYIRESVASSRLAGFGNKAITELLVQELNEKRSTWSKETRMPPDSAARAILGGELLRPSLAVKMSKNGVLELYYSNTNKHLITPISLAIIDKLSAFYIDLKIKKATFDYIFTVKKIDSLEALINRVDRKAIHLENTSFFTPQNLEFDLPKERVNAEKARYTRQRDIAYNNKEEAIWRLQKATPIISVLDKPTEPFIVEKPSYTAYAITGFIAGVILAALLLVSGIINKYARYQIYKSIFGTDIPQTIKS